MASNRKRKARTIKQLVFLAALLVAAVFGIRYYYRVKADAGLVTMRFDAPGARPLKVEVAATPAARRNILRYRNSLPPDHGVIFVYPAAGAQPFSTTDVYVALDAVLLDETLQVVGVVPALEINASEPRELKPPCKYVLALPAGAAAASGIKTGARAALEHGAYLPNAA